MFRVAVTTTTDRSAGMAAELVAVGLTPVELPCIEVISGTQQDLARARAACEEADLVVLASSRPLDILWPDGSFPETPAAVIGPATATRVAERGGTVRLVGDGDLLHLARSMDISEARIAIPHAPSTDPRALAEFADRCRELMAVAVYSTAPVGPEGDAVEGAVFVSASAVQGWAMTRSFDDMRIACLGQSTMARLQSYGRDADVGDRHCSYSQLVSDLAEMTGV